MGYTPPSNPFVSPAQAADAALAMFYANIDPAIQDQYRIAWPVSGTVVIALPHLPAAVEAVHAIMQAVREAFERRESHGSLILPVRDVIVNPIRGTLTVVANRNRMGELG